MIRAILIDLDGTLIRTPDKTLFDHSLELFGLHASTPVPPEVFVAEARAAMQAGRANLDPMTTVGEIFYRELHERLGCPPYSLVHIFQRFYENGLGDMRVTVRPHPAARELVRWLSDRDYAINVAADPAMNAAVVRQFLHWSDLDPDRHAFNITGTLDSMHFSRPRPHYFEELLARLDLKPEEALMVGDDLQQDIEPAARAGLNTFWVQHEAGSTPPATTAQPRSGIHPDGHGTLEDFLRLTRDARWLDTLAPPRRDERGYTANLLGTLAAIDSLLRESTPDLRAFAPGEGSWSLRDAVCHLRDHETEVDQHRLRRILEEDNPFISATGYDPRAHTHEYVDQDTHAALRAFAQKRGETVAMLDALPPSAWDRPARHSIFGPTTLGELVRFMADHDRIHLRQMRSALEAARQQIGR